MDNKVNNLWIYRISCILSSILKQWRIIVILVMLCASLFDVFKTITYSPSYSASATVAIIDGDGIGLDSNSTVKGQATIRYLLNSGYIKKQVNKNLNQSYFNGSISFDITSGTNLCKINVYSSTQKDAYFQLKELIGVYQEVSDRQAFGYNLNVVDQISFSNQPLNYNVHTSNYKKGFILSFGLIVAVLAVYNYLKDNIKSPEEINDKIDARLYAKVPKEFKRNQRFSFFNNKKTALLVSHFSTGFSYIEAMNKLASKIENSATEHNYKTVLITSSLENEGKSSVSVNLAISLAKNKHKVLIVDADMRKPALHKIFEQKPTKTLTNILKGEENWKDSKIFLEREQIDVIFSSPTNESQELLSEKFNDFIHEVKNEYDFIIVDSAPSRYIQDSSVIAPFCDATLLVIQQNKATVKVINDTIYYLLNNKANIIGSIFNGSVFDFTRAHSSYGYRYGYYRYGRERRSK